MDSAVSDMAQQRLEQKLKERRARWMLDVAVEQYVQMSLPTKTLSLPAALTGTLCAAMCITVALQHDAQVLLKCDLSKARVGATSAADE